MLHISLKGALPMAGALALTVACGSVAGCKDNTAEKAGERLDDAADKAIDAIDDAADEVRDAVDDAVDAVTNDPNVPPTGG